jgi:hypothetical protein
MLERIVRERSVETLVVVAPPRALADLRKTFHPDVKRKIIAEIDKDLTKRALPIGVGPSVGSAAHQFTSPSGRFAGFGVDVLLLQPVSGLSVNPIETHFFAERRRCIESNGTRDQRKSKIALPIRRGGMRYS